MTDQSPVLRQTGDALLWAITIANDAGRKTSGEHSRSIRRKLLSLWSGWGKAWQEESHAVRFDPQEPYFWWRRSNENRNEFRLFEQHSRELNGRSVVDIGCATGDLFRWLQDRHPEFRYHGYDVSSTAIARAKEKYPEGEFDVVDAELSDLGLTEPPSVLRSRDVVFHQLDPLGYLGRLLRIPSEAVVLPPTHTRPWRHG